MLGAAELGVAATVRVETDSRGHEFTLLRGNELGESQFVELDPLSGPVGVLQLACFAELGTDSSLTEFANLGVARS